MKKEPVYVYESPDGGKTVFRRPFGKLEPKVLIMKRGKKIHPNPLLNLSPYHLN
jgi:hypothetical protein